MIKTMRYFCRSSLIIFILSISLYADVKIADTADTLIVGADAHGRGGAYLAADDSNHYVFQNYSFLHSRQQPRASLAAFRLLNDISYLTAAYTHGNFSFGLLNVSDSSGYLRDENNKLLGGKINYSDSTIYGAYGVSNETYGGGVRLKYYSRSYSGVEASAAGTAVDLAAFVRPLKYFTLGLEACNLVSSGLQWSSGQQEEFLSAYGLGVKIKAVGPDGLLAAAQTIDVYLDMTMQDERSFGRLGLEYWMSRFLSLRLGASQYLDVDAELQEKLKTRFAAGLGFNWNDFYFDYAYSPDDIAENMSHFFTLAYRFGRSDKTNKKPQEQKTTAPVAKPVETDPWFENMFNDVEGKTETQISPSVETTENSQPAESDQWFEDIFNDAENKTETKPLPSTETTKNSQPAEADIFDDIFNAAW